MQFICLSLNLFYMTESFLNQCLICLECGYLPGEGLLPGAWCCLGGDARIICYDNDPVTCMGGYWERNWWPKLSLSAFVSNPKSKSKIGTVKNGQKYPRSRRARNGTEVRGPDLGRVIDGSQFEVVVIYVGTRNNVLIISQVIRLLQQNSWQTDKIFTVT